MSLPNLVWFRQVNKKDIRLVGGKGANLGEMFQAKIPVPDGFIVTSKAYFDFIEKSGLKKEIYSTLKDLDVDESKKLQETAEKVKKAIIKEKFPQNLKEEIIKFYKELGCSLVAVRSSATAEDLPDASFAGQQRTFLNVSGEENLIKAVQGCWASLFEPRAIFYRSQKGFDHFKVGIAVPVQKMVEADVSGVLFTIEPVTNDRNKISIEAVFGLGEAIVSGAVTPDQYLVDKKSFKILEKLISRQEWQLVKRGKKRKGEPEEANIKTPVSKEYQKKQKLSDTKIVELAKIGKAIEEHYKFPQDVEWAKEENNLYIVQSRPVTTLKVSKKDKKADVSKETIDEKLLLSGSGASPGVGVGSVKVIHKASEIDKVKKGDVLVTEMTTPDFVPAMQRAVAIVTDRGGRTCHAAIVSRELGIPCVVGTETSTKILRTGELISVDGNEGKVYAGKISKREKEEDSSFLTRIPTATKVYVNLAEPELSSEIAKRHVDGVGLLRAEFMIADIGKHPRHLIVQGKQKEFVEKLSQGIGKFAESLDSRPVIYRATDFKTNEYRNLVGGAKFEDEEENPMLGFRGCFRYITDDDVFELELRAIKRVRRKFKNLWLMIPFVRTVEELTEVKKIISSAGLYRSKSFKLWIMVEVPSSVIMLEEFIKVGIDGVSIGSNDLTMLILGLDRDNPKVAPLYDERNEAVLWALEKTITTCIKNNITCSICGQAPSDYPDLTQKLVEWGITSVSVSPDAIEKTREIISEAEHKLVKQGKLKGKKS